MDMSDAVYKKMQKYLSCLQRQLCFVNDCLIGIDSIVEANRNPKKDAVTQGFVTTAFLAMQDDVIVTLSKMVDNTRNDGTICVNSLITALQKNAPHLSEEWQQSNYDTYCSKYNIDNYIRQIQPIHVFYTITDAIKLYNDSFVLNKAIIDNINAQRDKYYPHNDKKYFNVLTIQKLEQDYPLDRNGINQLIKTLYELIVRIAMATGNEVIGEHSFYADNFKELII